jgi:nitrite reductase/ring-hydroxylating ferredoxin subunit
MSLSPDCSPDPERRHAVAFLVNSVVALVGSALAGLLGVFALRPPASAVRDRWIRAGSLADLTPEVPVPRVLTYSRVDGWYRERARQTVFLVWDGVREVRALSATCTHLGCQVRWDGKAKQFGCPCHGGLYDAAGRVVEGPPPRPLASIEARIDDAGDAVLVRL